MAKNDFTGGSSENFEQKWLCVFLIDVSALMEKDSLKKFDKELQNLRQSLMEDPLGQKTELCILTFGQGFQILQEPTLAESFKMPLLDVYHNYHKALENALIAAADKIEKRKCWYKETGQIFYRPILVLTTNTIRKELFYSDLLRLRDDLSARKYDFLNIGVDGSSILAIKDEILIRLKEDRSLFQMLFHVWDGQIDHLEDEPIFEK